MHKRGDHRYVAIRNGGYGYQLDNLIKQNYDDQYIGHWENPETKKVPHAFIQSEKIRSEKWEYICKTRIENTKWRWADIKFELNTIENPVLQIYSQTTYKEIQRSFPDVKPQIIIMVTRDKAIIPEKDISFSAIQYIRVCNVGTPQISIIQKGKLNSTPLKILEKGTDAILFLKDNAQVVITDNENSICVTKYVCEHEETQRKTKELMKARDEKNRKAKS